MLTYILVGLAVVGLGLVAYKYRTQLKNFIAKFKSAPMTTIVSPIEVKPAQATPTPPAAVLNGQPLVASTAAYLPSGQTTTTVDAGAKSMSAPITDKNFTINFSLPQTEFLLDQNTTFVTVFIPKDFSGLWLFTVAESGNSPAGDTVTYKVAAVDAHNNVIDGPYDWQYTGGTLHLATKDRARPGYKAVLEAGNTFQIAIQASKPCVAWLWANGTAV